MILGIRRDGREIDLIAGLYDDYEGQILINGTDIREWGPGRIAAEPSMLAKM